MSLVIAVVWHFWLGVALCGGAVAAVIGLVVGYTTQVTRTRYPKK